MSGTIYFNVKTAGGHVLDFDNDGNLTIDGNPVGAMSVPRVLHLSSDSPTPAIDVNSYDAVIISGQSSNITSLTSGLAGTPTDGQTLRIAFIGTASFSISHGAAFESSTVALPTTTNGTNRLDVAYLYNALTSNWRVVGVA